MAVGTLPAFSHLDQPTLEGAERPLRAGVVLGLVRILHKFVVELVERVVGEVAAALVNLGGVVLLGRKARKALLVQVDRQRVPRRHEHVQAHVRLETIEKERRVDVARDDAFVLMHVVGNEGGTVGARRPVDLVQPDALATVRGRWLEDPHRLVHAGGGRRCGKLLAQVFLEGLELARQVEGGRHVPEILVAVLRLHLLEVHPQVGLECERRRFWELVHLLMWQQAAQIVGIDLAGAPKD